MYIFVLLFFVFCPASVLKRSAPGGANLPQVVLDQHIPLHLRSSLNITVTIKPDRFTIIPQCIPILPKCYKQGYSPKDRI